VPGPSACDERCPSGGTGSGGRGCCRRRPCLVPRRGLGAGAGRMGSGGGLPVASGKPAPQVPGREHRWHFEALLSHGARPYPRRGPALRVALPGSSAPAVPGAGSAGKGGAGSFGLVVLALLVLAMGTALADALAAVAGGRTPSRGGLAR